MASSTPTPILDGPIIDDGPIDTDPDFPQLPVTNVLTDIAEAVANYPRDFVDILFVDVEPASGDNLNTGEEATFKLQVRNSGPLTMRDVSIKLVGKNGTKVKTSGATFTTEAFVDTIATVAGENGTGFETGLLHLKAPTAEKTAGTDLVEAYVDAWNADWQYTLNQQSDASTSRNGLYESAVVEIND